MTASTSCIICSAGQYQASEASTSCAACLVTAVNGCHSSARHGTGAAVAALGIANQCYATGAARVWIADPGSSLAQLHQHDEAGDCTLDAGICTSGQYISNMAIPTRCNNVYRGQLCNVICGYGYYFSGDHRCNCDGSTGICSLSGGSCQPCPQLASCPYGPGGDNCACYQDNGQGNGCDIRPGFCYIDNWCRMDSAHGPGLSFALDVLGHTETSHKVNDDRLTCKGKLMFL